MRVSFVYNIKTDIPVYFVATPSHSDEQFNDLLEWCLDQGIVESSSLDCSYHRAFWVYPNDYEQAVAFRLRVS